MPVRGTPAKKTSAGALVALEQPWNLKISAAMFRAVKREYATSSYPNNPRRCVGGTEYAGDIRPEGGEAEGGEAVERGPPFDVSCIVKRRISFNVVRNQEAYEFTMTYI